MSARLRLYFGIQYVISWRDPIKRIPLETRSLNQAYAEFTHSIDWDIPHFIQSIPFIATDAARRWGLRPSEMGVCLPKDDIAVMMAYADQMSKMEAVENFLHNQKMRAEAKKNRPKGKK